MRNKKHLVEIQIDEKKVCKEYCEAIRRNFEKVLKMPKYRKEMREALRKSILEK